MSRICRIPLNWFKSYLTKRRQFVEISKAQSETLFNKYSVPQGSVLGPLLLFLIYINDLHNAINYSDIHHFADDTVQICSTQASLSKPSTKKINFDLKNIVHWLRLNKISLNTSNTEIILFRTKKVDIKKH